MPVRNQNWYNLQEGRRYPLDDRGTGIDDVGEPIRDNIIVDCHIRFPSNLGKYLFVQAITVSPKIVTVLFGVSDDIDSEGEFKSIAAITLPKPIQKNTNYNITPLVSGVAGWIAFGSGVEEPFAGRYSTPIQSFIQPRTARPYRPLPIPTLGKLNLEKALTDIVNIQGVAPVVASYRVVTVDGVQAPAIVFELQGETTTSNPLKEFLGPCGKRPESGTCDKPAIQTINGVSPDCDGNIVIEFDGFTGYAFEDCGGIDIGTSIGLQQTCESTNPPKQYSDLCAPSSAGSDYWPDPTDQVVDPVPPDIFSSISLSEVSIGCIALPACYDFAVGSAQGFMTRRGLFVFDNVLAPNGCQIITSNSSLSGSAGSDSMSSEVLAAPKYVYTAADITSTNIATLQNCHSDWAIGKTIAAELLITTNGLSRNGGLIVNYLAGSAAFNVPSTYILLKLEVESATFKVLRFNGSSFVTEYSANYAVKTNTWYRLEVTPLNNGNSTTLMCAVSQQDGSGPSLSAAVDILNYGQPVGQCGFYSSKSYTRFNKLTIEN